MFAMSPLIALGPKAAPRAGKRPGCGGFTLLELLVVISVIAILVALLIPLNSYARLLARSLDTSKRLEEYGQALLRNSPGGVPVIARLHREVMAPFLVSEGERSGAFDIRSDTDHSRRFLPRHSGGVAVDRQLVQPTDLENNWFDPAALPIEAGAANPWCLMSPWGRDSLSATGNLGPPQSLGIRDMCPRLSANLLTWSGIMQAKTDWGMAMPAAERKPWNDAWGHPLIIGVAFFQASGAGLATIDGVTLPFTLYDRAQETYQFTRALYVCPGAVGYLTDSDPEAAAIGNAPDPTVLWKKILEVCLPDANQTWNETSFANPPWQGVKRGQRAGNRSFLSAPIEIR